MNNCNVHNVCIDLAISMAENICVERGLKFTALRKHVLKIVWQNHTPVKAYDILKALNQEKKNSCKPVTVYRALDFLVENRMVHKIHSQNAFLGCLHPLEVHNCYFTICKSCNKASEGCGPKILKNIKDEVNKNGFILDNIVLEIYGLCKECNAP